MTDTGYGAFGATVEAIRAKAVEQAVRELISRSPVTPTDQKLIDLGMAAPPPLIDQEVTGQIEFVFQQYAAVMHSYGKLPDPAKFREAQQGIIATLNMLTVSPEFQIPATMDGASVLTGLVTPAYGNIDLVRELLVEWDGQAADNFRENFLGHLEGTIANHFVILSALRAVYEHNAQIWTEARANAAEHLSKGYNALVALFSGEINWSVLLTATASIATIAAALPLGLGTAGGLVIAGVDAAASFGPAVIDAPEERPKLIDFNPQPVSSRGSPGGAGTAAESVVQEIMRGLKEIVEHAVTQENRLASFIYSLRTEVTGRKAQFVPPAPDMSAATTGPPTSFDFMGVPKHA
ncbi:hypothetical protein GCM10010435_56070 [Winogradskya consettensis]|uniref:Uncharacterized protein n=1 Tax=Winogradskya consettensis TaxID=113560 RepID=A0A919S9R5_9ACTN|nr:hypothetical protein [Actinoplanes consettensis]GIM67422.1 hypothetical protein Aco04nite_06250 [Actinoplanes consettensis]